MVKSTVVVGDGWAALAAVGLLTAKGVPVYWIAGSGSRLLFPLSSLEWGPGLEVWTQLLTVLGLNCGKVTQGVWMREFRNKAFRDPLWKQGVTPKARSEIQGELLWGPEKQFIGAWEAQLQKGVPIEWEDQIRKRLGSSEFPHLEKIQSHPVTHLLLTPSPYQILGVRLASGRELVVNRVIYADLHSHLPVFLQSSEELKDLQKNFMLATQQKSVGVLQADFIHDFGPQFQSDLGLARRSFFTRLLRGSQEIARHVWGYFLSDSRHSQWTVCLTPEEVENNQEISKHLKNLKTTLNKMFQGSDLLPPNSSLSQTIIQEQVRFEEVAFCMHQKSIKNLKSSDVQGLYFLTDRYGPTRAFEQVGQWMKEYEF